MSLQFNISYDPNLGASAKATVNAVAQFYSSNFSDNVTINLEVGLGKYGLNGDPISPGATAASLTPFIQSNYSQLLGALGSDRKSSADTTAFNSMPASDPATGTHSYWMPRAEEKALGLLGPSTAVDGQIGISTSDNFTFNTSNGLPSTPGTYDLFSAIAHEISEVMGRSLLCFKNAFGTTGTLDPLDLFHWQGPGARTGSGTTPGYFSIDGGAHDLLDFNTNSNGDFGDWAGNTADAYNAFGDTSGTPEPVSAVDLTEIDILGWDRAAPPISVAQALAAYNANPNLSPVSVSDTTANVSGALDALQVMTAHGKLSSITLSDSNRIVASAAQLGADSATLGLIAGPYRLQVNAGGGAFSYTFAGNVNDLFVSGETSAAIVGNGISNVITLGSGNDTVHAGDGGSYIVANGGNDQLFGGAGGGAGGPGNTIYANGGNNFIQGGAGSPSDVLVATGSGNDTFYGGSGNNYIVGGTGQNTIVGGGGASQTLYGNGANGDYIVGGSAAGASNVLVENGTGAAQLWGGSGNDYIVGGAGDDLLVGGGATNYLFGAAGNDTIYGGAGTNYIYPGPGSDFIWTNPVGVQTTGYIYEGVGTGVDTVADFTPGDGANHDVLVMTKASSAIASFADVQAKAFQAGVYTVLPISNTDQIYLYNVQPFQLTGNDFIFT